jgi:HD-like signal output (HDOD) protein
MVRVQALHSNEEVYTAVKEALQPHFEVSGAAVVEPGGHPEGLAACDLFIVDLEIPEVLDTVHGVRNVDPDTEILLLLPTQYEFKTVSALFRYGVKECLIKPFTPEDIIAAVCKAKGIPLPEGVVPTIPGEGSDNYRNDSQPEGQEQADGVGDAGDSSESGGHAVKDNQTAAAYLLDNANLPMMPQIAMRIVRLCRSPDVTADQLEKVISSDQAFTAQLLKTANSALYKRAVPVQTIPAAIVRVGLKNVNNLAIGLSASSLHVEATPRSRQLWQTSRTVAAAAQVIAQSYHLHENAYVAGLLHNVGMTLMNNLDSERFEQVDELVEDGTPLLKAEVEVFGANHAQLGMALVKKWEIDLMFGEAILSYMAPWDYPDITKSADILAASIHLAQVIMDLPIFKNATGEPFPEEEREKILESLASNPGVIHIGWSTEEMHSTVERLEEVFIQDATAES